MTDPSRIFGCVIVFAAMSGGCVKKYVEVRVRDGGAVGVGAAAGPGYVPVLAPDGSQGMASLPPSSVPIPIAVVRQGHQIAALWPGAQPIDLVNGAGTLPPMRPGEGLELRGGSLYAYYQLAPTRVYSVSEHRPGSVPIVLSTPANNIADAVEIHEPYHWPAYVFLPTGGLFMFVGAAALTGRGETWTWIGGTYLVMGIPLIVVGLVNAMQGSEAVPLNLVRGPGP